jgi:hypothetical protein
MQFSVRAGQPVASAESGWLRSPCVVEQWLSPQACVVSVAVWLAGIIWLLSWGISLAASAWITCRSSGMSWSVRATRHARAGEVVSSAAAPACLSASSVARGGMRTARGQDERDPQPVRLAQRGHAAVVRGGDCGRDGQSQAGTGSPGREPGPVEAVEDAGKRSAGTPRPSSLTSTATCVPSPVAVRMAVLPSGVWPRGWRARCRSPGAAVPMRPYGRSRASRSASVPVSAAVTWNSCRPAPG